MRPSLFLNGVCMCSTAICGSLYAERNITVNEQKQSVESSVEALNKSAPSLQC